MAVNSQQSRTMLEPLRPAVVVRRRIEEVRHPPPSSVDPTRAQASLRRDEEARLEQILSEDEVTEEPSRCAPLVLGQEVSMKRLATQLGVSLGELVGAVVSRGYFALHSKSLIPRSIAEVIAGIYGRTVVPDTDVAHTQAPRKSLGVKKSVGGVKRRRGSARQ